MKTIICCACLHTFQLGGDIRGKEYFPNRMVYNNHVIVKCPTCAHWQDMILKGESYIGTFRHGVNAYFENPVITENNILFYQAQVDSEANKNKKVYCSDVKKTITLSERYQIDLTNYKAVIKKLKDKNDTLQSNN